MKTKGTRRRKALRCFVYSCTILTLLMIPVSIWFNPFVYITTQTDPNGNSKFVSLDPCDAVFSVSYYSQRMKFTNDVPLTIYIMSKNESLPSKWYALPSFQPGRIELPLVYPSVLMIACSALLFRANRRKHPAGHCPSCNYNLTGLVSPTCPECGHGDPT